jgi:hypothetical protein
MSIDREKALEEWAARELRRLPPAKAPRSMIPRVWAAIEAAQQPVWWHRPWLAWPLAGKLASLPVFLALLAAVLYGGTFAMDWMRGVEFAQSFGAVLASVSAATEVFASLLNAAEILHRAVGIWIISGILILFFTMYLICLAAGTACYRLVLVRQPNLSIPL